MHYLSQLQEKWGSYACPSRMLVARAPIIPLGGQTLGAQAPRHSYPEGLMGTSQALEGTQA